MNICDYLLAGREDTPVSKLSGLASHSCYKIRARVAENQAVPEWLLCELSKDEHIDVRIAVGANATTPQKVVLKLAADEHPDVRYSLAENPWTDILALFCLAKDENPYISQRALKTIKQVVANSNDSSHRIFPPLPFLSPWSPINQNSIC